MRGFNSSPVVFPFNSPFRRKTTLIGTLILLTGLSIFGVGCNSGGSSSSGGATTTGSATLDTSTGTKTVDGSEIVIGEYASFTGESSDYGKLSDNGIKLAVKEVNAAGGIDVAGKKMKVRLETEDDASDPTKADTAVKRLIDEKNVTAILGEVLSACSLSGGKIAQEKGVPMISPAATNVTVTQGRDCVFRVCFLDSYQAAVIARYIRDGLKKTKVAIMTNKGDSYSIGFSDEFKKAFVRYGGSIVLEKTYANRDTDYRAQLTSIKSANPEAILIPGGYGDSGSIIKQAREMGIDVPLLGGDGWGSTKLMEVGGAAVKNCYFSDHMSVKDPRPIVQEFVKSYRTTYNTDPQSFATLGYDAAKILFDAISRARSTDKKAIRDALAATRDFEGVSGKISIDENRNAKKSAVIITVKNGQFDYVTSVPDPEKPLVP